jgi:hypothetical protein
MVCFATTSGCPSVEQIAAPARTFLPSLRSGQPTMMYLSPARIGSRASTAIVPVTALSAESADPTSFGQ